MLSLSSPRLYPCLWFNYNAEEAARFYTQLIPNSSIQSVSRYPQAVAEQVGVSTDTAWVLLFRLDGQLIMALNGGPTYPLTPAASLMLTCTDQAELDHYWEALLDGGSSMACGWLTDRFGLSWQVVPQGLVELLSTGSSDVVGRVMEALMQMVKIDIGVLEAAARG